MNKITCQSCQRTAARVEGSKLIVTELNITHRPEFDIGELLEVIYQTPEGKLKLRDLYDRKEMEFINR